MFDNNLYNIYQDILHVASAGNDGSNDKKTSQMNTIDNPAACKNTVAIGASESTCDNVKNGDMGMNYIARLSSRGPTADNRIKPYIVAPEYAVLSANAHSTVTGRDTKAVIGMSCSAPVAAGLAAIVRQHL